MATGLLDKVDLEDVDVIEGEQPEEYDPDPAPAGGHSKARRRIKDVVKPADRPVSATVRKRLAAEIEAYTEMVAIPWIIRDPLCGQVVHDQAKPVAESLAAILARYPDLAAKIIGTSVIGDFAKLALAVKPIITVVWAHHVSKTVEQEESSGPAVTDYSAYPAFRGAR